MPHQSDTQTLAKKKIVGTANDDTLAGTSGNDVILGGRGDDVLIGNKGDDVLSGGAGDDTFTWQPGDGDDRINGGSGRDGLILNGSAAGEFFTVAANKGHLTVERNIGAVHLDATSVESVVIVAADGADHIRVGDLSATDTTTVFIDLGFGTVSGLGDGALDSVEVDGSAKRDALVLTAANGIVEATGLAATVRAVGVDTGDTFVVALGAGDDRIDASGIAANTVDLSLQGGAGDDVILGSDGADRITADDGNDVVSGGAGADRVLLGAGNDRFVWRFGDGSDLIDGGNGQDQLVIEGGRDGDSIVVGSEDGQLKVGVESDVLDLGSIERIDIRTGGGRDEIEIDDMAPFGVRRVAVDLGSVAGKGADGVSDVVLAAGSGARDIVTVTGKAGSARIQGLAAQVTIAHVEADDLVGVFAGDGDDVLRGTGFTGGVLWLDGGDGDDRIVGSAGRDLLEGGDGNDRVTGGRGNDEVDLGDGDDLFSYAFGDGIDFVDGDDGFDTVAVTGSSGFDSFLVAQGAGLMGFADGTGHGIDLKSVEDLRILAGGGADLIRVFPLAGTDAVHVTLDLAAHAGAKTGDGEVDNVVLAVGSTDDFVEVRAEVGGFVVLRDDADVSIRHADADDRVRVEGGDGDDFLLITVPDPDAARFTLVGQDGDDVLFGGAGDDTLDGGIDDDELGGGGGQDVMTGGTGADLFVFFALADSAKRADVITDFHSFEGDRISLSTIDANKTADGDQAFTFLGEGAFDGGRGELRVEYDANGATLFADVNGDKQADFVLRLASFDEAHPLVASDFVL